MNLGRCKGCRQQIRWTLTENGRHMPLDPDPVSEGGNVYIHHTDPSGREHVRVLKKGETYAGPLFVMHRVTCPMERKVKA